MSSPGQKRGSCGHAMASFNGHVFCARCRDKKKGEDPYVKSPESEYNFCIVLTPNQVAQLSTPSYRLKNEKREAKKMEVTPSKDSRSLDPCRPFLSCRYWACICPLLLFHLLPLQSLKRRSRKISQLL